MINNDKGYSDYMRPPHVTKTLRLNRVYVWQGLHLRLIKVTRKGFNLVNEADGRCVLTHHLYAKGMGGIEIPPEVKVFTFCRVPLALNDLRKLK